MALNKLDSTNSPKIKRTISPKPSKITVSSTKVQKPVTDLSKKIENVTVDIASDLPPTSNIFKIIPVNIRNVKRYVNSHS